MNSAATPCHREEPVDRRPAAGVVAADGRLGLDRSALAALVFAGPYMKRFTRVWLFDALLLLMIGAMNGVVLAGSLAGRRLDAPARGARVGHEVVVKEIPINHCHFGGRVAEGALVSPRLPGRLGRHVDLLELSARVIPSPAQGVGSTILGAQPVPKGAHAVRAVITEFPAVNAPVIPLLSHQSREEAAEHPVAVIRLLHVTNHVLERRRYGYVFGDAATGRDGQIIFGEDDDLGHLWLYFPSIRPL